MMVNVSRFTGVQNRLADLILEFVTRLKRSIFNHASLPENDALKNPDLKMIHETWRDEYDGCEHEWIEIQRNLKEAVDPVEVITVNSASTKALDYGMEDYPQGRSVITVGGIGLSRGLTLEGLITTYFLRKSIMYDTLMQMGRWFGYRDGYSELCRIFMAPEAASWYGYIADATEELRGEFRAMETAKLTPREFGLKVRSHPTSLIVTARNKMRSGRSVPVRIALDGRLVETSVIHGRENLLNSNRKLFKKLTAAINKITKRENDFSPGHLWKSIPSRLVVSTIEAYENHPESMLTDSKPLIEHIRGLTEDGIDKFDVLLAGVSNGTECTVGGCNIGQQTRTVEKLDENRIAFTKRRVASKGAAKAGLTKGQMSSVEAAYAKGRTPDRAYLNVAGRNPLFIMHLLELRESKDGPVARSGVPAYTLGFPGDPGTVRRPKRLVEYVVNTRWWEQNYANETLLDDDPEDDM
jgi:hypothetical protein